MCPEGPQDWSLPGNARDLVYIPGGLQASLLSRGTGVGVWSSYPLHLPSTFLHPCPGPVELCTPAPIQ